MNSRLYILASKAFHNPASPALLALVRSSHFSPISQDIAHLALSEPKAKSNATVSKKYFLIVPKESDPLHFWTTVLFWDYLPVRSRYKEDSPETCKWEKDCSKRAEPYIPRVILERENRSQICTIWLYLGSLFKKEERLSISSCKGREKSIVTEGMRSGPLLGMLWRERTLANRLIVPAPLVRLCYLRQLRDTVLASCHSTLDSISVLNPDFATLWFLILVSECVRYMD